MDSKKIIEALVKVANNQQKIIHKLAQQALPPLPPDSLPTSKVEVTPGKEAPAPSQPPPISLKPHVPHEDATKAIVSALGDFYGKSLSGISVDPTKNQVNVSFRPGHATQNNYDHVKSIVQKLQNSKVLVGAPYKVTAA
jgi:hypothetical protein